jgi:hypothetical protein
MEITPEKLAFIHGTPSTASLQSNESSFLEVAPPSTVTQKRTTRPRQQPEPQAIVEEGAPSLLGTVLVPLTTRLLPNTADALRRAYLEQKLKGRKPATQQEIVEAAVQGWLRKEGYL